MGQDFNNLVSIASQSYGQRASLSTSRRRRGVSWISVLQGRFTGFLCLIERIPSWCPAPCELVHVHSRTANPLLHSCWWGHFRELKKEKGRRRRHLSLTLSHLMTYPLQGPNLQAAVMGSRVRPRKLSRPPKSPAPKRIKLRIILKRKKDSVKRNANSPGRNRIARESNQETDKPAAPSHSCVPRGVHPVASTESWCTLGHQHSKN